MPLRCVSPLLVSVFLGALLVGGCAATSVKQDPAAAQAELDSVIAHLKSRQEISGTLFVTAKIKGEHVTAPAVMLVQWPDKVRLEIQDPVGSTLALFVVNGTQFWLYQKSLPDILTGPLSRLPAGLGLISQGKEFVRAFLARPPLEEWKNPLIEGHSAKPRVAPDLGAARPAEVRWSDRLREPEEWVSGHANGTISTFRYEDYQARAGVSFPQKISLTHANSEGFSETASFAWRDWQPFVPQEKKLFQIPQQQLFGRKIKALH